MEAITSGTQNIYDMQKLQQLKNEAAKTDDDTETLTVVAKQFEALFVQQVMSAMREANEAFESDTFNSFQSKFFNDMHDEQLAANLSSSGGLGLAEVIVQQLSQKR